MTVSSRWGALDAFRGLTIAGMLLVNNPGSWDAVYPPLRHAAWHGWTPTDLVFPFFLFIVGITTELSLGRRAELGAGNRAIAAQILKRGALIFLLGLALNAFPFFPIERITQVRIPGVLQRIGVCYTAAALLAWRRSSRFLIVASAAILVGYWAALTRIAPPGVADPTIGLPDQTLAAYLDRLLLEGHLWSQTKTWDPEGPLSTIPAVVSCILGILAGRWVRREPASESRLNGLFGVGALGVALGFAWSWTFPINKNLWTSSYVVFTAGTACVVLATMTWLRESWGPSRWSAPLVTFGLNPLAAFIGSGAMARTFGSLIQVERGGATVPLQRLLYESLFASWLSPLNASLAYAVAFTVWWYLFLLALEKAGWTLRV